jgi:hypothetical protein
MITTDHHRDSSEVVVITVHLRVYLKRGRRHSPRRRTGTLRGLLAAVFGEIDWFAIPGDTRAKRLRLLTGFQRRRPGLTRWLAPSRR